MSDELLPEEAVEETVEDSVEEAEKPRKRATKKVAEELGVVSAEPVSVDDNVIKSEPKAQTDGPVKSSTSVGATGVIGSVAADKPKAKTAPAYEKKEPEKVALWSFKNIRWSGVGALVSGYNIVTKEAADKWLTRDGIREATPEEVAQHYGK